MFAELLKFVPQQWVGILALIAFAFYFFVQLVEKYATVAKVLPFGKWWHERQKQKAIQVNSRVANAIEDNEVIIEMQRQIAAMAKSSETQGEVITSLQETIRVFTAWSVYDAGWHHRHDVDNAGVDGCRSVRHYDFFAFERIWRDDPGVAARLADRR